MEKNRTVLVLEDDFDLVSIIGYILESEGFNVVASHPKTYRNDIRSCHPGVILLDHWLNGILGSTICEELKADPETHDIPVILTSASNNIEEVARRCKSDDVLPKPFDISALINKVSALSGQNLSIAGML
jgi:DNA-binding response OmpR family regulator